MIRRTRTLFELLREISLDDIRDQASRHFNLVFTGPSPQNRASVIQALSGGAAAGDSPAIDSPASEGWAPLFERASLVIYALERGRVAS